MHYSDEMKFQRELRNSSQCQLAKDTSIKQQNISRWENKQAVPTIENCIKLADYYGITIDKLIGHEVKRNW